jgi:hypothetical protein
VAATDSPRTPRYLQLARALEIRHGIGHRDWISIAAKMHISDILKLSRAMMFLYDIQLSRAGIRTLHFLRMTPSHWMRNSGISHHFFAENSKHVIRK